MSEVKPNRPQTQVLPHNKTPKRHPGRVSGRNPSERGHLFVVFGEELPAGGLVDGLSDSDDLSIAVADGHAQEGLGFVPGQLVDFIAEATILQPAATEQHTRLELVGLWEQLQLTWLTHPHLNSLTLLLY